MPVDPANASELKQIAAEIGADVLEGVFVTRPKRAVGSLAIWT